MNFENAKQGQKVEINGTTAEIRVSKGRKMAFSYTIDKVDAKVGKKIRGDYQLIDRRHATITFITDYGKTIVTTATFWYPSESYTMPTGSKTANMWDIYEANK